MLQTASPKSWTLYTAAHLLNRAAFGGTPEEIEALYKLGRPAAIEKLLAPVVPPTLPPVGDTRTDLATVRMEMMSTTDPEERKMKLKEVRQQAFEQMRDLRVWWVGQMMLPDQAVTEKATLFWHGHFATSIQKVKDAGMMAKQNQTLRAHALGNFGTMVKAMSRDPAMMIWLDLQRSEKTQPNENFAREVMELFTLGIGNYTENDIKESARAFTGYRLNRMEGTFRFASVQHDETPKTFMGKTGNFSGDDIIDIILEQPACPKFICHKLWTFYVGEDPSPEVIHTLAQVLRNHNYDLRPVFSTMFASEEFNSAKVIRSQIKSPVQLVVQTCRTLQCDPPGGFALQSVLSTLGQILFAPPNVKGWDGNRNWINTATLTARNEFTDALLSNRRMANRDRMAGPNAPSRVNIDQIIPTSIQQKPDKLVEYLTFRLYQADLGKKDREEFLDYLNKPASDGGSRTPRDLVAQMMKTVEFQLV